MAYVGADADVVGVSGTVCLPYWDGSSVYFFQTNPFNSPGIRKFNIDSDGDETLQRSRANIGTNWVYGGPYGSAAALSYDGNDIFFISDPDNTSEIAKVQASDLTLTGTVSAASSSLSPSNLISPYQFAGALNGGTSWLFSTTGLNIGSVHNNAYSINADTFTTSSMIGAPDEHGTGGSLISRHGVSTGVIYLMAPPVANDGAGSAAATGVYSLSPTTLTKLGTFLPTDIDATWTNIVSWRGICYDETDGNLIIGVQTTDAGPSNKTYIVKISGTTGAFIWKRAVNALTAYSQSFTNARVRTGTFHYIGSAALCYHITTSSGALASSETFTGLVVSGPQVSDDVTNSVILYGDFTAGSGPPTYVGTYMDTGGHHSVSSAWFRVWFATAPVSTPAPGDIGGLALSSRRSWTFTQDGHVFYVLDLDTEGTWLVDLTTEQWCKFVTSGYSRWNVQNGVMWGTRVVGGSIDLPIVWELKSTALDDDGDNIAHVVTGGAQTRDRHKRSVGAVRLTGSANKLGAATSSMRLRFSDDNGDSWSGYKTVSLTQGTVKEMAWRALGAYAAPGRVFEFSDTGGPVRLDGADMDYEGEDQDADS